jgi:peptide/nickel transport system substrate-binding protein
MRVDTKPFDDIRVRRAMSMAIDRQNLDFIVKQEGEILSFAYEANWSEDLYTPVEKLPESARELFEYNPEKAKKLLAEAGYPKGFQTEIVYHSAWADDMAMLAAFWKDIGVECKLLSKEYGVWNSMMYGKTYKQMLHVAKGKGGPFTTLGAIAGADLGGYNPAMFTTPRFEELYWKAKATKDIVERNKLCKEMNVYVIDQCPYIIMPTAYQYRYAWPWVKNYYGESNAGSYTPGPCYAQFWIDRDLREKTTGKR